MNTKQRLSCVAALLLTLSTSFARAEIVNIGSDELKALITRGTPVVDLRTAGEWRQTGVLKGSQLITLFDEQGRADPVAWSRQVDKVAATDKPVILICRSGNRSDTAAQYLEKTGRKGKQLFMPLRQALTGMEHGPELADLLVLIGPEKARQRLEFKKAA